MGQLNVNGGIDVTGNVLTPNRPAFRIRVSNHNAETFGANSGQTYTVAYEDIFPLFKSAYRTVEQNIGNCITFHSRSTSTGTGEYWKFTAPVAGIYIFTTILRIEDFNNDASYVQISLEGANDQQQTIISGNYFSGDPTYIPFTISYIAECDANDTVTLRWKQSGGTTSSDLHNDSSFSGHLLS